MGLKAPICDVCSGNGSQESNLIKQIANPALYDSWHVFSNRRELFSIVISYTRSIQNVSEAKRQYAQMCILMFSR